MSKFSKGDKARVIHLDSMDIKAGVKIGDVVTIDEDDTSLPCVILSNGKPHAMFERQLQHVTEPSKEITLNGATYVLKDEPKPDHEWKFGDIAVHPDYGVGIVFGVEKDGCVCFKEQKTLRMLFRPTSELTFIRRTDFSV